MFAAKPGDQSSIPRTCMVERENQLPLSSNPIYTGRWHKHMRTQNKEKNTKQQKEKNHTISILF